MKVKNGLALTLSLHRPPARSRTPLGGVVTTAELLQDQPLTSAQKELVSIISASSNYLMRILNDVLLFSKTESHKVELEMQPMELRPLFQEVRTLAPTNLSPLSLWWSRGSCTYSQGGAGGSDTRGAAVLVAALRPVPFLLCS